MERKSNQISSSLYQENLGFVNEAICQINLSISSLDSFKQRFQWPEESLKKFIDISCSMSNFKLYLELIAVLSQGHDKDSNLLKKYQGLDKNFLQKIRSDKICWRYVKILYKFYEEEILKKCNKSKESFFENFLTSKRRNLENKYGNRFLSNFGLFHSIALYLEGYLKHAILPSEWDLLAHDNDPNVREAAESIIQETVIK
jgi:hypothetical protein